MQDDPKKGIVGGLYYQRGGAYSPVIMQQSKDKSGYYCLTHEEVSGRLQKVDVTGGGCMLMRKEIFDKIDNHHLLKIHYQHLL